jgi:Flp pilus assembly protein TadD
MRRRIRRLALAGLVGVLPIGCVGPSKGPFSDIVPPLAGSRANLKEQELPPHEAAKTCLATAEMMERHGHDLHAIDKYQRARQHDPRLKHVSRRLAVLYDRQGDFQRALVEYQQALALSPRDPDLLNDLGYCHYQRGDWIDAEKWFRQALEVNGQHQLARVNLAMTLGMQGRFDESHAAFAQALGPAEAAVNMGFVYQTHGRWDDARAAYEEALRLRPGLALAEAALEKLNAAGSNPGENVKDDPFARPMERPGELKVAREEALAPASGRTAATPGRTADNRGVSAEDRAAAVKRLEGFMRQYGTTHGAAPEPVEVPHLGSSADIEFAPEPAASGGRLTKPIVVAVPER